jgi:hypothetical protein
LVKPSPSLSALPAGAVDADLGSRLAIWSRLAWHPDSDARIAVRNRTRIP